MASGRDTAKWERHPGSEHRPEAKAQQPAADKRVPEGKRQPKVVKEEKKPGLAAKRPAPPTKKAKGEGKREIPEAKRPAHEEKKQASEVRKRPQEGKRQTPEAKKRPHEAKKQPQNEGVSLTRPQTAAPEAKKDAGKRNPRRPIPHPRTPPATQPPNPGKKEQENVESGDGDVTLPEDTINVHVEQAKEQKEAKKPEEVQKPVDCEFQRYGCSQPALHPADMQIHMQNSVETHLKLLDAKMAELERERVAAERIPRRYTQCAKGHNLVLNTNIMNGICRSCNRRLTKGYWECKNGCLSMFICSICQEFNAGRSHLRHTLCHQNHPLVFSFIKSRPDASFTCTICHTKSSVKTGRWYCWICQESVCVNCQ
jgi:hypothetical protein